MLAIYMALIDNEDDKKSFENLFNQNKSKAFAIAIKILKNRSLAEDACSEAFFSIAKCFQKIKKLEAHKLDYYIVITVKNAALNLLKRENEHIKTVPLNEEIHELCDDALSNRNYNEIVDCIKQLSYSDQEILYLRVDLGLDYSAISKALHISNAAARQRFKHAKDNLAKLLKKEGIYNG
ncbi:MAG: sigma-70 family RNA polymerase sigma factor [Alistipes sp.]|nr:sigma-70 family RNA polymerase sigma factor [Alistipes sp.]